MLKGSAKRFISFEKNVTSWSVLKRKLKKEFKVKLNSALIHSQLYRCKRQPGESSRQYIYAMLEIAEQGYIEEDALIQYIVEGLPDEDSNKTSLYEACTISELKKKLEVYDRLKERIQKKKTPMKKDNPKAGKDARKEHKASNKSSDKKHCFNCGSSEHDVKNCTDADKGPKCFKCNCFGHIASKCNAKTNSSLETTPATVSCVNSVDDEFIMVDIKGRKSRALLDTGSPVSLIRNDVYSSIGEPKLNRTTQVLTGLGNATTKPSGTFLLKLHIGNDSYEIKAFVVPTNSMTSELILGRDFLEDTEVVIKRGQIEVRRLPVEEYATETTKPDAMEKEDSESQGFDVLTVMPRITVNEIEAPPRYKESRR